MLSTYDNLKLCSYVFAADSYDNSKKIFEGFLPLIESILVNLGKRSITFSDIQTKVDELYNTKIPKATLSNLLSTLRTEGKIRFEKNIIYINSVMFDEKYYLKRDKIEGELNDLFLGYREFLLENDVNITYEDAKESICKYVFNHCYDLAEFIGRSVKPGMSEEENTSHISYLLDYINICKQESNDLYQSFLRLYNGAVQSTLLNFNPENIEKLQNLDLQIKTMILDSNFIMRMIGIQTEIESQMAKETVKYLKNKKVDLVVLSQTIDEICNTIKVFLSECEPYSSSASEYFRHQRIKMSGMLSALQRGISRTHFYDLSKKSFLKEHLENEYNVCVLEEIELPKFKDQDLQGLIAMKGREGYSISQASHDLGLISYCRQLRDKNIDTFKEAKCWVLTNDFKLTFWNQINNNGIQECITETQLSNLIWIQSPKDGNSGLTNTMVTLANREYINSSKFFVFIDKMQHYKEKNKSNVDALDKLSLVFACDCLKTEEIQRILDDGDQETDNVISEKVGLIRQELENKKLLSEKNADENARLKLELKISELKRSSNEIDLNIVNKKGQQDSINNEISNLRKGIDDTYKFENLKLKCGRFLGVALLVVIFVFLLALYKFSSYINPLFKVIYERTNLLLFPEWFKSVMLTFILSLVIMLLSLIAKGLIMLIAGSSISSKDLFTYINNFILKKLLRKQEAPSDYLSIDINNKRKEIELLINENVLKINKISEQIQDLFHSKKLIEEEISSLTK